jgi:anthranilate synthase/aminodeoxychorismate synthase-like glutamine amidotransferase
MQNILLIDNFDSFTFNLYQILAKLGANVSVIRNNEITLTQILDGNWEGILTSPGPCTPTESGVCVSVSRAALDGRLNVPLFGVCLGHQTLGHASGATVTRAANVRHGKTSPIDHDGTGLFKDLPSPVTMTRYHSLVITEGLPSDFVVNARASDDGEIMGIRHKTLPIHGVQFHPESVLSLQGERILQNFLDLVKSASASR